MKLRRVCADPEVLIAVDDVTAVLAAQPEAALAQAGSGRTAATGRPLTWRHRESLAARMLLHRLLAEIEPAARDAVIAARDGGQPWLPQWPGLAVSLSHDGGQLAVAVGRCAGVGIDVQVPPTAPTAGLVRRCLRGHADRLESLDDRARGVQFARVWTVQEACVKADGTGIGGLPWLIDVSPSAARGRWNDYDWATLHDLCALPVAVAWTAGRPSTDHFDNRSETTLLEVA